MKPLLGRLRVSNPETPAEKRGSIPPFLLRQLFLAALACFSFASLAQQEWILSPVQSVQLQEASIWGGISFNGENISVTTTYVQDRPHLFLRKLDSELHQIGPLVQLTFDSDAAALKGITDHKHLFLDGYHFVTFSVAGDSEDRGQVWNI